METNVSFGAWVRRRRRALDLTQDALARQVGCARITIQKIEAGERRPSREFAALLAEHLGVPLAERDAFQRAARSDLATPQLGDLAPSDPAANAIVRQSRPLGNLPARLIPCIGRVRELAQLGALLANSD